MLCYARHFKHVTIARQTSIIYKLKMPRGKIVYWMHEMSVPPPTASVVMLLFFFSRVYSVLHIESLKNIYTLVCPCGIYGMPSACRFIELTK